MRPYREAIEQAKREYLEALLCEANGKVEVAAMISGLNRTYLYRFIDQRIKRSKP